MALFGVNLDKWNRDMNYRALRLAGVRFAMVKATQGHAQASARYMFADECFSRHIKGLASEHIPAGAYHIFTAASKAEAQKEADFFIQTVTPHKENLPLYLACQVNCSCKCYLEALSKDMLTELVLIFLERVRDAGFEACLYAGTDTLRHNIDLEAIDYPIWQAHYISGGGIERPMEAGCQLAIHQYTKSGQLVGVPGDFALSFGYKQTAKLIIKHEALLDDAALDYLETHDGGDGLLLRIADKLVCKTLRPIKDPSPAKLANVIAYHCLLDADQKDHLLSYDLAKELLCMLYNNMLCR